MPVRRDEAAARTERARAIGLFRYQLIREAADPALSAKARGQLVRQIAAAEHVDPAGRAGRVSRDTLDRWIRTWRAGGFDALVPSARQSSPRLPTEMIEMAVALKRENPQRTAAQVHRILRTQIGWAPGERTLQRHFAEHALTSTDRPTEPVFGRFANGKYKTHHPISNPTAPFEWFKVQLPPVCLLEVNCCGNELLWQTESPDRV